MTLKMFSKFVLPMMACVSFAQLGAEEWKAPEDVVTVVARESGREALVTGLGELEGDSLKAQERLVRRFLPGGDLASWLSPEEQVVMMKTWAKAS